MRLFFVLVFVFVLSLVVGCVPPPADGPRDQVDHSENGEGSRDEDRGEDGDVNGSAVANAGQLVDLRYKFKTGEIWKYTSTETTFISMSVGDMPGGSGDGKHGNVPGAVVKAKIKMKYKVVADFYLKFTKVRVDGSADFVVEVDKFKVQALPAGKLMATDQGLDLSQLTASGNISPKGNLVFYEEIYVLMNERNERYLVKSKLKKVKPGGKAFARVETDDNKVKVFAKFDPKTGEVTGGAIVEEKKKARKQPGRIEVSGKDKRMYILPKRFMRMFRLPVDKVAVGTSKTYTIGSGVGNDTTFSRALDKNNISFLEYNNGVARLQNVLAVSETVKARDMDNANISKMTGKVKVKFDQNAGKLKSMQGDIKATMNAGMKMNITSHLNLQMR